MRPGRAHRLRDREDLERPTCSRFPASRPSTCGERGKGGLDLLHVGPGRSTIIGAVERLLEEALRALTEGVRGPEGVRGAEDFNELRHMCPSLKARRGMSGLNGNGERGLPGVENSTGNANQRRAESNAPQHPQ